MRRIWNILTMRCAEADRLQAIGRGDCTRSEWLAMRIHQCLCRGCRAARRQLQILQRSLREMDEAPPGDRPEAALTSSAKSRLQARLDDALRE